MPVARLSLLALLTASVEEWNTALLAAQMYCAMLTGRKFRLNRATLAIEYAEGNRSAVSLPSASVVQVTSGPTPTDTRMVDITWRGRQLIIFAVDLQERGEDVEAAS